MNDVPTRPPASPSGQLPKSPSGPPQDPFLVEVDTPPVAPAGATPAVLTPPTPRRSRAIGGLPMWVLVALGLVAANVGLLVAPSVVPWSRSPVQSPLDDAVPGFGSISTEPPASPSAGPPASPSASPDETGHADATGGPDATISASPSAATSPATSPGLPSQGVEIASFVAAPLSGAVLGYRVTVELRNRDTTAQVWHNVAVHVNGGVPLSLALEEPASGVRVFAGLSRACLAPAGSGPGMLDAGQSLTMVFRINASLSHAPGPVRLNDTEGCASAES